MENEYTELIPTGNIASTKKIEKQRSFCLKKKNQGCRVKFRSPSLDQCK